jgi:short-subunit dehydrogenase
MDFYYSEFGKWVMITGSSQGLGRSLGIVFAKNGFNVILNGRDKEKLEEVRSEINELGMECEVVVGDLRDEKTIKNLGEIGKEKEIEILINNAAISYDKFFWDFKIEEIEESIDLNLIAPIKLCKKIYELFLKKKHGIIVNINSMEGLNVNRSGKTGYSTSKFGLKGFTDALRYESKKHRIFVKGVYLSGMKTEMYEQTGRDSSNCMDPIEVAEIIYGICEGKNTATVDEIVIGRKRY